MDENMNMNPTPVSSEPVVVQSQTVPPQATTQPQMTQAQAVNYASFFRRFGAALIDGLLLGFTVGLLVRLVFGAPAQNAGFFHPSNLVFTLAGWAYQVFMINKYGATLGKMALGIRVQNESTGANLTLVEAVLREVAGKFLSGIALLIGYFWVIWDPKKQAWHDKLGKSVVIKVSK